MKNFALVLLTLISSYHVANADRLGDRALTEETSTDCTGVSCDLPMCGPDETLFQAKGDCCPSCIELDCSAVSCFAPDCAGTAPIVPPGECCPQCDCTQIFCLLKICNNETETTYKNPGECCPQCATTPTCESCDNFGYFDGCNECSCDENGEASCTDMACTTNTMPYCLPPDVNEEEEVSCESCASGRYFNGCGNCVCGEDGVPACTPPACPDGPGGEPRCDPTVQETVDDLILRVDNLFERVEALLEKLEGDGAPEE